MHRWSGAISTLFTCVAIDPREKAERHSHFCIQVALGVACADMDIQSLDPPGCAAGCSYNSPDCEPCRP